jgi:zinc transporter ZupT
MSALNKNSLIAFQTAVALGWVLGVVWWFFVLEGAGAGATTTAVLWYWCRLLSGPVLLLTGSISLLRVGHHQRFMSTVALVGSGIVVFHALRSFVPAARESYLRDSYWFAMLLGSFVVMSILSGVAAFKNFQGVRSDSARVA